MVVIIAETIHVDEEVKRIAKQCGLPLPEHLQEETERGNSHAPGD